MNLESIIKIISGIANLGGWVAVAIFFMGQETGYISNQWHDDHTALISDTSGIRTSLEAHRVRQEDLIQTLKVALRVMCENNAKSNSELNNCKNIR